MLLHMKDQPRWTHLDSRRAIRCRNLSRTGTHAAYCLLYNQDYLYTHGATHVYLYVYRAVKAAELRETDEQSSNP